MLKKPNRIRTSFEFGRVRKYGKLFRSLFFDIYVLDVYPRLGPVNSRFGIVISNKFSKSAVVRNRVRRVFREVLRLNLSALKSGFWVVIYPKFASLNKGYAEINTEFNQVLPKIHLLR
ncbi:ribonuclease P protein component [candidate division WWE3 bacterium]|nr:ribonuclease P protein component [candidate division WWE3 bacterium]